MDEKRVDELFDGMIEQQRAKVLRLAREALPYLSPEDVLNPDDHPELKAHPTFDYEDGILAGLVAAQIAFRAETRVRAAPPSRLETQEE
jgi:hypothetical protein